MFPTYGKTSVHRGSYGKKQGNFYVFFYFSGFEKVRRLIISQKGVEKGNFPLSLSVKTPPTALRSESVKLPFPFAEYARRARRLCGKIADVRERTATQESVSLTRVSTAFSQKSCQTCLT